MRLTEIQIDRCGSWRDLTLPITSGGLCVLYGPNETGKSTLVHFIRGVLYGFSRRSEAVAPADLEEIPLAGSLLLERGGAQRRVYRSAVGATRGTACLINAESAHPAAEFLDDALQGVSEEVYDRYFSAGVRDLQELRALSDGAAAKHVFDLALGPAGERLLAARRRSVACQSQLMDPLQQSGELVQLLDRQDQLLADLKSLDVSRQQHSEWCHRRSQLEQEIAGLRQRQAGLQSQLRGHQFLERTWGPWNEVERCEQELAKLPEIVDFPARGLERLDRLESEIAEATECRDRLLTDARQIRNRARDAAGAPGWRDAAAGMQGFVDQRGWLAELRFRLDVAQSAAAASELEFEARREKLGRTWSTNQLESLDLSAEAQRRLMGSAQSFQAAVARRKSLRRKCRRLAADCRDLRESLAEAAHELGDQSSKQALVAARERLRQLHDLSRLELQEAGLRERQRGLDEHRERIVPQLTLPGWVYIVLSVFCFMGVVLAGWSLIAGVTTSGIAGAIYALLGITCGGLAWGLKTQFEGDARRRLDDIAAQSAENESQLRQVQNAINQATDFATPGQSASPSQAADATSVTTQHIIELEELASGERRWQHMRHKLKSLRKKLEIADREVGTARQNWRDTLAPFGFQEALEVNPALDNWQALVAAADRLHAWRHARREVESLEGIWNGYQARLAAFCSRLSGSEQVGTEPLAVLDEFQNRLLQLGRERRERQALRTQFRSSRREAAEYQSLADELKVQRNALLVQGGAANRDEFEDRARLSARRICLEDHVHDARHTLDAICSEHTDLALVDEDLRAYDASQNADCIDMLQRELADIARDQEQAYERLGAIKQEIERLETDRTSTQLRYELERIRESLARAAHDWAAIETAGRVLDEMFDDYERTHQPASLAVATRFLNRLTGGRYRQVWTPLGKRQLTVDDDQGRRLPVTSLSRGTREQLFLAVRLAVVAELARSGISLPVILDDVIVNFDHRRAAAAADLLIEFAEEGHQLLFFTCHLHLAHLFESKGVEPIWLPDHRGAIKEQEEQRLAG